MQRSSEQPLVGEERYVTTLITAAKETREDLTVPQKACLLGIAKTLRCVLNSWPEWLEAWFGLTSVMKSWIIGKCNSRLFIGLAIMVYEPIYQNSQIWIAYVSA